MTTARGPERSACAARGERRLRRSLCLLGLALTVLSCGQDDEGERREPPVSLEPTPGAVARTPAGQEWIDALKRAHAEADLARSPEQLARARASLEASLASAPTEQRPGSVWLRQDLLARLAQLDLELGELERAIARAGEGLSLSAEISVPASNLLVTQAKALERKGDKARAVDVYHRALVMNQALMERSLRGE